MAGEPARMCPTVEELPSGWQVKRLGSFCTKIGTGATPRGGSEVYLSSRVSYSLVRSQHVFDRHFDSAGLAYISESHANELRNAEVHSGDVLLNITGDGVTFGRSCIVPDRVLPACVNQHVSIIRPDRRVCDPGYLLSVLTHPAAKGYIESFNSGGSRRAITKGHIESFEIPLPPLAEQKAIAAVLGALDDKIELNRRMNATLEAMARALFQSWFVDFDPVRAKLDGRQPGGIDAATAALFPATFQDSTVGHMPQGWKVSTLDELTSFVIGGDWGATEPTDDETVSCYCIRGADIPSLQSGGIGKMPTRFLKSSSVEKRQLKNGDLVIEISGGSPTQCTGRPVLASDALLRNLGKPLVASNFCRIVNLKSPALSKFVYLWLRRLYDSGELFQFETGTTGIKNFAFVIFSEKYPLVVPDLRIAEAFDRAVSPFFAGIQANSHQSRTLATLRDTLLPKLLSGDLLLPISSP